TGGTGTPEKGTPAPTPTTPPMKGGIDETGKPPTLGTPGTGILAPPVNKEPGDEAYLTAKTDVTYEYVSFLTGVGGLLRGLLFRTAVTSTTVVTTTVTKEVVETPAPEGAKRGVVRVLAGQGGKRLQLYDYAKKVFIKGEPAGPPVSVPNPFPQGVVKG